MRSGILAATSTSVASIVPLARVSATRGCSLVLQTKVTSTAPKTAIPKISADRRKLSPAKTDQKRGNNSAIVVPRASKLCARGGGLLDYSKK